MLERLFGSATRLKLLKTFLFQADKRFLLDDLAKLLKLKPESVRRELDNLLQFGLIQEGTGSLDNHQEHDASASSETASTEEKSLKPKKERNVKYVELNRNFVLNEELKTLIARGQVLYEREFINKLLTTGRIKYLMLSGFFVNRTDAPVDLLIVGRINKVKLVKIINEFEKELGREVNFTHFEPQEFLYRRSLADVFIYELLEGPNMVVIDELYL
jgi:hypothetical protein